MCPRSGAVLSAAIALALTLSLAGAVAADSAAVADYGGSIVRIITSPPGAPITNGQFVTVQVPRNHILRPGVPLAIEECAAPNFGQSLSSSICNGTTRQLGRVVAHRNGSLTYADYLIMWLPTPTRSHRFFRHGLVCDSTHACVLAVGSSFGSAGYQVWSHPFFVGAADPGLGTPEVPQVLLLPVLACAMFGAWWLIRRRRPAAPNTS